MKLVIDKLGLVTHAEIDVRPLTVFFGPNNTNKTWVAYCLYGLARHLMVGSPPPGNYLLPVLSIEPSEAEAAIDAAVQRAISRIPKDSDTVRFSVSRKDLIKDVRGAVAFRFSPDRIYDLLRLDWPTEASATMIASEQDFAAETSSAEIEINKVLQSVSVNYSGPGVQLSFAAQTPPSAETDATIRFLTSVLKRLAYGFMGRAVLFALPSERKALVATYRLLRPEYDQVLSAPVVEFAAYLMLTGNTFRRIQRPDTFAKALSHLEGGVLHGSVDYEPDALGARLAYKPQAGLSLPMHAASSLVRALAGLDLYLRYWAHPGDLLIIDEPEMNAHPEAQLAIAELITLLVNQGVRIVLTTHSPYLIDHLTNLVEASTVPPERQDALARSFKLGTKDAFLIPDRLAVYLFQESGEVADAFDREARSIDWGTFSKVTDEVTNLYGEILEAKRSPAGEAAEE
jgi:hypothetical protein